MVSILKLKERQLIILRLCGPYPFNLICVSIQFTGNRKIKGISRRVPEHQTASMITGEVKIFQRSAIEHCNLNSLYFTVMKTEERMFGKDAFIFYAIAGDEIDGVAGGFSGSL